MTEKLYMGDCYKKSFSSKIEKVGDDYIVLKQSAFYPEGGGQPADHGTIQSDGFETRVTDVQKRQGEVRHYVDDTSKLTRGDEVEGQIDWERRYSHMRMHTAQHLLSAVVLDMYDAETVGNQIHADYSRMDFSPINFTDEQLEKIENRCNSLIQEKLPVTISNMRREQAEEEVPVGRTNLDLIPDHVDPLRIVEIEDYDICPCGGTHLNNIKEIGRLRIKERTNKGADTDRIVFELEEN